LGELVQIFIDASNAILGRLASRVAKLALEGNSIVIANAEKAIVSGERRWLIERYKKRREIGIPPKGPKFPRTPDGIVRRAIRGMLPWKKDRGRKAFRRIKVFVGIPEKYKDRKFERIKEADLARSNIKKYLTVGALARELGARW
jgi:large subunit ribosomal protein L13